MVAKKNNLFFVEILRSGKMFNYFRVISPKEEEPSQKKAKVRYKLAG